MSKRIRRIRAQIEQLRQQMYEVLARDHPQSVRHVFYRRTDPLLPEPAEKSPKGYRTVQDQLVKMRRAGDLSYDWIVDMSRTGYFVDTYGDPAEAVETAAKLYRCRVWDQTEVYIEVWCESRSIAGVLQEETERFAVPLYPCGGFASLSLAYQGAEHIKWASKGRPTTIIYVGDYDPAGVLIDSTLDGELRHHLPANLDFQLRRIAITPEQIDLGSVLN